jgi:hypothetical protein
LSFEASFPGLSEGRSIDEPAPGPGEQYGVPSAPAQAQTKPLQDQTSQQVVDDITQSTSVESALHSLPKPSDSSDNGWTDKNMAEVRKLNNAFRKQFYRSVS